MKVWALLLRTGWPCILILWCFFNVMAASLYVAELLPYHTWYYVPWSKRAGDVQFRNKKQVGFQEVFRYGIAIYI
jgi:hypothetical protein